MLHRAPRALNSIAHPQANYFSRLPASSSRLLIGLPWLIFVISTLAYDEGLRVCEKTPSAADLVLQVTAFTLFLTTRHVIRPIVCGAFRLRHGLRNGYSHVKPVKRDKVDELRVY